VLLLIAGEGALPGQSVALQRTEVILS